MKTYLEPLIIGEVNSVSESSFSRLSKTSEKAEGSRLPLYSVEITAKLRSMKTNLNIQYQTANLHVSPASGEILSGQQSCRLGPINMQVLVALMVRQGQVVSRAELFDCVWKNQIVSDDTLTRCISDLRGQLGKFNESLPLIETLPKKGYRWLPIVDILPVNGQAAEPLSQAKAEEIISTENKMNKHNISEDSINCVEVNVNARSKLKQITQANLWKSRLVSVFLLLVSLFVFSTVLLWLVADQLTDDYVKVALLPVDTSHPEQRSLTTEVEAQLKRQLLATRRLRYLSSTAMRTSAPEAFTYLASRFGAQWIIESEIRKVDDKHQLTLNLVSSQSALVIYSDGIVIDAESAQKRLYREQIQHFCQHFIQRISQHISQQHSQDD